MIEMNPPAVANNSDALHGEKVGVGTLLVMKEYHRMASQEYLDCKDYEMYSEERITNIFGPEMASDILEENKNDAAKNVTAKKIQANWNTICEIISRLPKVQELETLYKKLGLKASLNDIDVSHVREDVLLQNAPMVRNRLTLLRLRKCFEL